MFGALRADLLHRRLDNEHSHLRPLSSIHPATCRAILRRTEAAKGLFRIFPYWAESSEEINVLS
eukprot:6208113-Pleurochrysis_carterae.AAC.1